MGTKKFNDWNERVVQKNNTGTYTISVPIDMIQRLRWQQGQRVLVKQRGAQIIIKDAPKS
jgi:hypothetical protein